MYYIRALLLDLYFRMSIHNLNISQEMTKSWPVDQNEDIKQELYIDEVKESSYL